MKSLTAAYEKDKLEFIKNPMVAEFLGLASNMDLPNPGLKVQSSRICRNSLWRWVRAMLSSPGSSISLPMQGIISLTWYSTITFKVLLLIDLKTTQISHQDVGQMDMYVRMYDELKRTDGDNPTIGLILCTETSRDIARYSVLHENPQLFAAKYLTYLPKEEELREEIERQKEIYSLQQVEEK